MTAPSTSVEDMADIFAEASSVELSVASDDHATLALRWCELNEQYAKLPKGHPFRLDISMDMDDLREQMRVIRRGLNPAIGSETLMSGKPVGVTPPMPARAYEVSRNFPSTDDDRVHKAVREIKRSAGRPRVEADDPRALKVYAMMDSHTQDAICKALCMDKAVVRRLIKEKREAV